MLQGRRGPFIVGGAVIALVVLMFVLLVLPKMGEVSAAREDLAAAQTQQSTLESQLAALEEAELLAPEAKATIQDVDEQIPPTADEPGFLLQIKNSAAQSTVSLTTITPGIPTPDPATGLTTIPVAISGAGSYFSLTEFLYSLETLPRAAKVENVTVTPVASASAPTGIVSQELLLTANIVLFTTDTSAGPGSEPGPTGDSAAAAPGTTTTTDPVSPT
jgi:Tfp pilus assembly protein PilO